MRKLKYGIAIAMLLTMLIFTACQNNTAEGEDIITGEVIQIDGDEDQGEETDTNKEEMSEEETTYDPNILRIEKIEGDLIELKPTAYDPDGDKITYKFSEPFNNDGEWQTEEGDTGEYLITVTASDGTLSTTEEILVVVKPTNKAPIINCPDKFIFEEGEIVTIECDIEDPEGDIVLVEYSGWMETEEKETGYNDAGEYQVTITASDGERESAKTVEIIIKDVNRAPEVQNIEDITIEETEAVDVEVQTEDKDGDEMTIEFSEPLDESGEWTTKLGDAGEYEAYALVSDGDAVVKKIFTITVSQKNTAPNLEYIEPVEVNEGETINLDINTYDREGNELTVDISGWMETETYTTNYDDAGEHIITVTVSDGELTTSQDVEIKVNDVNRPPVFKIAA